MWCLLRVFWRQLTFLGTIDYVLTRLNYTLYFNWNSQKQPSTSVTNAMAVLGRQSIVSRETWVGKLTLVCTPIVNSYTTYPKRYAHGFVMSCSVVAVLLIHLSSYDAFIDIVQGCSTGNVAIIQLHQ